MSAPYDLVVIGLTLSSSWGNGHATTYRALLRGLHGLGQKVLFLERDVPWYATNRDLPAPDFCALAYFADTAALVAGAGRAIAGAGAVMIGSYVPDGPAVIEAVHALRPARLCFYDIDTPVTLAKLERGDEEYLQRQQIPFFDIYFSFSGGPILRRLESQWGARRALPLYCAVDAARYRHTGEQAKWDLGYLGTYSPDRQGTLERLLLEPARRLAQMRFVVAGPQYPEGIAWPANVERIEHLAQAEHASFYSRQRFTLNITRADMIAAGWSPSVRLFEAGACNTPVISDPSPGLVDFFPEGEAIVIAQDSGQVVAALSGIHDAARSGIAANAHRRVIDRHTGAARAGELLKALDTIPPRATAQTLRQTV